MGKLTLQFHADRDEVFSWVAAWAREMNLYVALESFDPEYTAEMAEIARIGESSHKVNRLSLSLGPIDTSASSSFQFLRRNPDLLVVSPAEKSDEVLRESAILAMTEDEPSLVAWKTIRSKAKALMRNDGVSVVNPASGARESLKSHYYSQGARELAERGIRLVASAGSNLYEFDDGEQR